MLFQSSPPALNHWSQPMYSQPMVPTQQFFRTPTHINLNTTQLTKIPSKRSCQGLSWKISLCIALTLLLAVLITVSILFRNTSTASTTTTTTIISPTTLTTSTTLPSTTITTITTDTTITTSTSTSSSTTTTSTMSTDTPVTTSTTTSDTTTTVTVLPGQCLNYASNTDATRKATYYTSAYVCDNNYLTSSTMWVRFSGGAGTMIADYVPYQNYCGTNAPGWYSGNYPGIGNTSTISVCYYWNGSTCYWSNAVSVTNCSGYYVYQLIAPPACNLRYCTI